MSEPVTQTEIEDVLSSIRRLVADDAPAPMEPPATPKAEGADKLVLTPALRIQPQENKVEEPADAKRSNCTTKKICIVQFVPEELADFATASAGRSNSNGENLASCGLQGCVHCKF